MKDLIDQHINRLTVISREANNKHNRARWLCKCDCGNYKVIDAPSLLNKSTKSCGCYNLERSRKRPYESLYNRVIAAAEDRQLECTISYERFIHIQ
jgi:hypothetical protein